MANTFTQLYIHVVIAVRRRENLISPEWKQDLYKYMTGIVKSKGQKMMIINGVSDHVHLLIGMTPTCTISDLMRDIKCNSSNWIQDNHLVKGKFEWQRGFGAFSVGARQVKTTIRYILNQEKHHGEKSFRKEFVELLETYEVEYKPEYLFEEIDGV